MDFTKLDEKYNDVKKIIQEIENYLKNTDYIDKEKLKEELAAKSAIFILKSMEFSQELENLGEQFKEYFHNI